MPWEILGPSCKYIYTDIWYRSSHSHTAIFYLALQASRCLCILYVDLLCVSQYSSGVQLHRDAMQGKTDKFESKL